MKEITPSLGVVYSPARRSLPSAPMKFNWALNLGATTLFYPSQKAELFRIQPFNLNN
jgi:hypothetical protein